MPANLIRDGGLVHFPFCDGALALLLASGNFAFDFRDVPLAVLVSITPARQVPIFQGRWSRDHEAMSTKRGRPVKRVEGSMVGGQSSVETLCLQRDYAIIDMRRALMRDDAKLRRIPSTSIEDRSRIARSK